MVVMRKTVALHHKGGGGEECPVTDFKTKKLYSARMSGLNSSILVSYRCCLLGIKDKCL